MPEPVLKVAAWEDFVLRSIGVFKIFKAIVSIAIGFGLREMLHHHQDLDDVMRTYIFDPMHFDSENKLIKWALDKAATVTPHNLRFFGNVAFFYAAVFATEGVGLFLRKHWAEYMVLVSTGALLPVEFYEIYLKLAWWKMAVVVTNLAILLYLVHRLFLDSRIDSLRVRRKAAREREDEGKPPSPPSPPSPGNRAARPGPVMTK